MRSWLLVGTALASGVLLLALVFVAASVVGEPVANFTRDPTAVMGVPWYTGSVSLITCMVWAATAAMSYLVAWAVRAARWPMSGLAVLTSVLAVDDALLVHDQIGPARGVPEILFALVYAVLALLVTWSVVRSGSRATVTTYLLGAALLGASLGLDQVFHDISVLIEDSTKLLGVLVWATLPVLFYDEFSSRVRRELRADASDGV